MHHFEQIFFFRSYLLKMLSLKNLKNLNTFPRKFSIFIPLQRKNILDVTNLPSWVNNSQKRFWQGLIFLINIGKIIVPEISLPVKTNLCVKLLRKSKKDFYSNLNVKRITDSRKFWQTIKPNFTEKTIKGERITLVEGDP